MKTLAFFNNKGGVGKTSLVYHLAWMYKNLGLRVLAADYDPQANLTSMFIEEDRLEELWPEGNRDDTVFGAIRPLLRGEGDIRNPHIEEIDENIGLLVGDLGLSEFEDDLSSQWPECLDGKPRAFRVLSAFYRIIRAAAHKCEADVVLIDVGPNLGAINRAALIAAEHVVIPLAPDIYSLQGLANLGPTLKRWRGEWKKRLQERPADLEIELPTGEMDPVGYVVMQHAVRLDRPVKAYAKWMARIPGKYRTAVLDQSPDGAPPAVSEDPECLAELKHFRSLMPMAMEAHKPMFRLKPADGAIGAHVKAVTNCGRDFESLAKKIAARCGLTLEEGLGQTNLFA